MDLKVAIYFFMACGYLISNFVLRLVIPIKIEES